MFNISLIHSQKFIKFNKKNFKNEKCQSIILKPISFVIKLVTVLKTDICIAESPMIKGIRRAKSVGPMSCTAAMIWDFNRSLCVSVKSFLKISPKGLNVP